jgi:hypothetical protein
MRRRTSDVGITQSGHVPVKFENHAVTGSPSRSVVPTHLIIIVFYYFNIIRSIYNYNIFFVAQTTLRGVFDCLRLLQVPAWSYSL